MRHLSRQCPIWSHTHGLRHEHKDALDGTAGIQNTDADGQTHPWVCAMSMGRIGRAQYWVGGPVRCMGKGHWQGRQGHGCARAASMANHGPWCLGQPWSAWTGRCRIPGDSDQAASTSRKHMAPWGWHHNAGSPGHGVFPRPAAGLCCAGAVLCCLGQAGLFEVLLLGGLGLARAPGGPLGGAKHRERYRSGIGAV